MNELLWLLLPAAAASGWFAARRSMRSRDGDLRHGLAPDYFKGLNYLLNEQPDKAIEVFLKLIEVDSSTLETHYALGNLYRRRGEVDRAIRVHQNLISRPELDARERALALLELGYDYMKAGLFDRAESLFLELVDSGAYTLQAYSQLLDIYQQENDWDKAIAMARKLEVVSGVREDMRIAQYYCEQAERFLREGDSDRAFEAASQARAINRQCARSSLLKGRLYLDAGEIDKAIEEYKRVEKQDPDYLPEAINPLLSCYREKNDIGELMTYLQGVVSRHGGITPVLTLAELIREQQGDEACVAFITGQLRHRPSVRGLDRLIELTLKHADGEARSNLGILKDMTGRLLQDKPVYKCGQCGFSGRSLHWQCPGCKSWNTVKPIQGIQGE